MPRPGWSFLTPTTTPSRSTIASYVGLPSRETSVETSQSASLVVSSPASPPSSLGAAPGVPLLHADSMSAAVTANAAPATIRDFRM